MLEPVQLNPDALYDDGCLSRKLGVPRAAIDRARRTGELRHARKGTRVLYTGRWVLDWLTADAPQPRGAMMS